MRLGVVCEASANSFYRAIFPLRALERRGHSVLWPEGEQLDVPLRKLATCDLVHCYRRIDRLADLRELSRLGVAISYDNDDDYSTAEVSPGGKGLVGRQFNNRVARASADVARLADVVTTTSARLADHYRGAGAERVVVIDNRLESTMAGFGSPSKHDGVVVGWVAESEHRIDLERIPIAVALQELLTSHPELRVLSVGLRLPLRSDRYEHLARVDFLELIKTTSALDIGLAPLVDTPFNRARSDAKLKEYGSGGAAWLASPVGPYRGLGERQGGQLVADDEWTLRIGELLRSGRMRRRLAGRGLRWAKKQTIDRHAQEWEREFLEAIERAEARSGRVAARSAGATL